MFLRCPSETIWGNNKNGWQRRRYRIENFYLEKKKKATFNIACIFKSCNLKSFFHVLSHTMRTVNRENAHIHLSSSIHWTKMEAVSFKEWELWMRTTWNARVQSPAYCCNACSNHDKMAKPGKTVQGDSHSTPPHPTPPHPNLSKYFRREYACVLHPRISSLALAAGAHAWAALGSKSTT